MLWSQVNISLWGAGNITTTLRPTTVLISTTAMQIKRSGVKQTRPAMMDFHEVAARIGAVLERPVAYVAQSPGAFREVLGQFIKSAWQLDAVCELFAEIAAGSLEEQTSTTADLLGRPALDLEAFAKQFAGAFALAN